MDRQIFVDVAGGDKAPRKGGPGVTSADLLVINKIDLVALVGADLGDGPGRRGQARRDAPTVFLSAVEDPAAAAVAQWVRVGIGASAATSAHTDAGERSTRRRGRQRREHPPDYCPLRDLGLRRRTGRRVGRAGLGGRRGWGGAGAASPGAAHRRSGLAGADREPVVLGPSAAVFPLAGCGTLRTAAGADLRAVRRYLDPAAGNAAPVAGRRVAAA